MIWAAVCIAQRISNRIAVPNGFSKGPAEQFCNETLPGMRLFTFGYKNKAASKFPK
jgi:hypothetical protein